MGLSHSPRIVSDNLVLCLDAGNLKSYDPNVGIFGQQLFTTTGTSNWTVPDGVTEISAVVVGGGGGGGGGGGFGGGDGGGGGGGGGLAYGTFAVTPGESLIIVVGTAGQGGAGSGSSPGNGTNGGLSKIQRGLTPLLQGSGGLGGLHDMAAQTDGVGRGGGASSGSERDGGGTGGGGEGAWTDTGGGGGGAAGYSGNGGAGKYAGYTDNSGFDGSGGGGGGGGAGQSEGRPGASGGGVGLLGEGSSGVGGSVGGGSGGTGGSGGGNGTAGNITTHNAGVAGAYGGGGGGGGTDGSTDGDGGDGGQGAIRIIWGAGRSYPSTSTADMLASPDMTNIGPKGARNISSVVGAAHTTDNGGAFVFDGTDDHVTTGNTLTDADELFADTGRAWSASSWFNSDVQTVSDKTIISRGGVVGPGNNFIVRLTSTNLKVRLRGGTDTNISTSITVNTWYNVVVTWDGTTANGYLNGQFVTTIPVGTANIKTHPFCMGIAGEDLDVDPFNGKISQTLAYNRALTAAEVKQNFNALRGRFGI